jgi:hypothetical protein
LKQLLFDYEFWFENKKPRVKRRKENIWNYNKICSIVYRYKIIKKFIVL